MILGGTPSIVEAARLVRGADFYRPAHEIIFSALVKMQAKGKEVDLVTVKDELASDGVLEKVGGIEYVVEIAEGVPNTANLEYYAKIVASKSMLRSLIASATETIRKAYEAGTDDAETVLSESMANLCVLAQGKAKTHVTIHEAVKAECQRMRDVIKGNLTPGWSWGIERLNAYTGGLMPGRFYLVGARPGVGKSSLLKGIALQHAKVDKRPVLLFSLEMDDTEYAMRTIQSEAQIEGLRLVHAKNLTQEEMRAIAHVKQASSEWPLYIYDDADLDVHQMRLETQAFILRYKTEPLVCLDYLQLLNRVKGMERASEVEYLTHATKAIKAMARKLHVPIVAAAQLNRGSEKEQRPPGKADLRGCGTLEQDADVIVLLHSPLVEEVPQKEALDAETWARIAKCRGGRETDWEGPGSLRLTFRKMFTEFVQK